jgi:DNA polymerase-4
MADRLGPLPVGKIWGVGPVTNRHLEGLGIKTIAQLREWPLEVLENELGQSGIELHHLAHCRDTSEVIPDADEKSISHETTFARDILDREYLEATLRELSDKVASRLRRHTLTGRVVCVKVRYHDFSLTTRRKTLPSPTDLSQVIFSEGLTLLRTRTEAGKRPIRLIGIGMAGLEQAGERQGNLFTGPADAGMERMERLERVADDIRAKLGRHAIGRASGKLHQDDLS